MTPEQQFAVAANNAADLVAQAYLYASEVTGATNWVGEAQLPAAPQSSIPWNVWNAVATAGQIQIVPPSSTPSNPYELVVPFAVLADFIITVSGSWVGTVSAGGLTGEWLSNSGADWLSDGTLVVPLDATKLKDAIYWHVDVSAIATIALTAGVPVTLNAFAQTPIEYTYDLDGTIESAAAGVVSVRTVFVLDASAAAAEIGFRFLAPSDPGLSCSAITGEVTIKPYVLQSGQSK